MVVGVEPLGHFTGMDATAIVISRGPATGNAEVAVEFVVIGCAGALWQVTDCGAHVQYLVVEREVADRRQRERALPLPVAGAEPCRGLL